MSGWRRMRSAEGVLCISLFEAQPEWMIGVRRRYMGKRFLPNDIVQVLIKEIWTASFYSSQVCGINLSLTAGSMFE